MMDDGAGKQVPSAWDAGSLIKEMDGDPQLGRDLASRVPDLFLGFSLR